MQKHSPHCLNRAFWTYWRQAAILYLLVAAALRGGTAWGAVVVTNNLPTYIVNCPDGVNVDALIKELGVTPKFVYHYALNGFAASMNSQTVQKLQQDGRVLSLEADGIVSLADQTIPAGVIRIGADTFPVGRSNNAYLPLDVGVAVLDSGIDPHPDLNIYTNYWTFSTDGSDSLGHGTSVAGVLAAQDNGFGVVGVAPGVRLWNVKCIGPAPYTSWSYIIAGMDYVTSHSNEIAVANMSFGNSTTVAPFTSLRTAVHRMVHAGIVVVAAAGNDTHDLAGPDGIFWNGDDALPASLADTMAVTAMDPVADTMASFSNFGQIPRTNGTTPIGSVTSQIPANMVLSPGGTIDLTAPGVNILTTATNGAYATVSGTSFAAPHVAGLVALYIAANGRASNEFGVYKIRQAIVDNSLLQSQWRTNHTGDPDTNPEPLAMASMNWVPLTLPIAVQPASQIICSGNTVSLAVTAVGRALNYQWLFNGTNLSDSPRLSGPVASTLTITNINSADAGNYQVTVTDAASNITLSAVAVLTILPPSLIQNGSFEISSQTSYQTGDSVGGTWVVESTTGVLLVFSGSGSVGGGEILNWHPTPAGTHIVELCGSTSGTPGAEGTTVLRQDLATQLLAGTNYSLSFLLSGYIDFRLPVQVTASIAPTGSTNEVFSQTFSVYRNADWTRQRTNFSVPADGLYSLRIKSTQGYVAFVDDFSLAPAPVMVSSSPPVFQNISRAGNTIALTWSAAAGQTHQLQYKTNLSQTNWLNVGAAITASNTTVSASDTNGIDPQRFYRVMVVP